MLAAALALLAGPGAARAQDELPPLRPDLRTAPPANLSMEYASGGRRLLRMANMVWNSGEGALELVGVFSPASQQTIVIQRLARAAGVGFEEYVVGRFVYHPTHEHFHLENFARYEVWSLTPGGGLHQLVASGEKLSYCLIETDIVDRDNPNFTRTPVHMACGQAAQGILPGWGDLYKADLDGQTVDVTRLSNGRYALLSTANPDAVIVESDYTNNTGAVVVELRNMRVTVIAALDPDLTKPADNQCTATARPALRRC